MTTVQKSYPVLRHRVRARTVRLLRISAAVTLVSGIFGVGFALTYEPTPAGFARSILMGTINGAALSALEIGLRGGGGMRLRPLPVLLLLTLRTLVYGAIFLGSIGLATVLVYLIAPGMPLPDLRMYNPRKIAISFAIGLAINFVLVLRTLLGTRTLMALVTGRYQQPQAEERIVMFLDLRGSTSLAERLGDIEFHRFLNRVFFDITDPILEAHGEIYRYIGDEIIVTWVAAKRDASTAAVGCLFAIADALERRRGQYLAEFGAAPQLRGALHQGPLVVGEMGDVKREIVMLGDTMNTAARIEEACRTTGRNYIASAPLVRAARPLPAHIGVESLGLHELRGKEGAMELFALTRT
jgi:adenylate cyclase